MTTPLETLLERITNVKRHGGAYQAKCPAHDDKRASLSVSTGNDGRVLLHCHAGCETPAILAAVGLKMTDLFPKPAKTPDRKRDTGRIVETYDYTDTDGKVVFQVCRMVPKDFRQRRPAPDLVGGHGGWTWHLDGVTRVLYRLPAVLAAVRAGQTVHVCEGEKDVHSLESCGLVATCNAGGAGKWRDDYSDALECANVVILPDNDEPGRKHAEDVARSLAGKAGSVRVVEPPDLLEKGDITDWIQAGHTVDELLALVESAEEWTPPPEREPSDHQTIKPSDFPLTDLGNAERLIDASGENLRYDVDAGKWIVWNGKRWEYDSTGEVNRMTMSVIRSLYKLLPGMDRTPGEELYKHIKKSESAPRLAAMLELARFLEGVPVQSADLDHDPMLLNVLNGTVDLRSGTLRPHTREDLITKLAPVEYNPNAKAPRWERFLTEVFQGDDEVVGFVRRMAGYCLTGSTREESVFMLVGKGENGKSKLVETLRAVLGDYAGDTPFSTFVERRDSNTFDLAALVGKRVITASEGEETQTFNESALKQLSGGDTITCCHKYRDYFSYIPSFKIVFSTNEVPRIRSQNRAMKRRLKLVMFRQTVYAPRENRAPVRDDQLLPKLLAEKNGILAWAVAGCMEWQRDGLAPPTAILREVERLFESQDPLAEWLDAQCVMHPNAEEEVGALWDAYLVWCEETKRKTAFKAPQWFSRSLTQRDGIDSARRPGGRRVLVGIELVRDGGRDPVSDTDCDASDANLDFSETSPMKGEHDYFPENTEIASHCVTTEREIGPAELYECGDPKCRARVVLTAHTRGAYVYYRYACESCGHEGVMPDYDYQQWRRTQP
ncbi:MAG: hypothetical protein A2Z18_00180 [Armatimonadetes bacterium RBG_16_58_9]|nr:MAG: hypothetical protein A2Z18_00180 [Armatimonadetes bacterium RBG_16_58_9]